MALPEERAGRMVHKTIRVDAGVDAVWAVLVSPEKIREWMDGATVETTWAIGSPITISGTLHDARYRAKGTVLDFQPGKVLKYNQWSRILRVSDVPENYSIITLALEPGDGRTLLAVTHERLASDVDYKHANFFWAVALKVIKDLVERDSPVVPEAEP